MAKRRAKRKVKPKAEYVPTKECSQCKYNTATAMVAGGFLVLCELFGYTRKQYDCKLGERS